METQLGAGTQHAVGYRDPVARSVPDPNSMRADQRVFHPDGTCDELLVGDMWVRLRIGVPYRTGGSRPRISAMRRSLFNAAARVLLSAVLLTGCTVHAPAVKGDLLKVVVVSRHGARTPLEKVSDLNSWTRRPEGWPKDADWNPPTWPHPDPGDLTQVGSELAALMGGYYGSRLVNAGLFPASRCPHDDAVFIRADVDERTRATGQAIARGFAGSFQSSCRVPIYTVPNQGYGDPLFHPTSPGSVCPLGAEQARQSIVARLPPGGFPALDKQNAVAISLMQDVLNCCHRDLCKDKLGDGACKLTDLQTDVKVADADESKHVEVKDGHAPKGVKETDWDKLKMVGAIGIASTASEIFLLEHANGMSPVGWGAVDTPKLAALLTLHNVQFEYMQRTPYIARRQGSMLLRAVLAALLGQPFPGTMAGPLPPADARFVAFVGHDTNVANLAALLHTDWDASEQLPDKTAPAGALLFELREHAGTRYVSAYYVAQTVEQLRQRASLDTSRPPHIVPLRLPCADPVGGAACRLSKPGGDERPVPSFEDLVNTAVETACVR